jgi:hypothetical protein
MSTLHSPPPYHRKNRRRERPGSRTRHSLSRKEAFRHDCAEGLAVARDANIHLPFEYAKPSPLRRQTFDQSWQKWKAREAEQKIQAERERVELENEQRRLFGGDVGDDVSLCLAMLDVVRYLFGGLDYIDP